MPKKTVFATMKILHQALMIGQVIWTMIAGFLLYTNQLKPVWVSQEKLLQVMALVLAAVAVFGGNKLVHKKTSVIQARFDMPVLEKLIEYRGVCMIQWASLEAVVLFCGICSICTSNFAFIALAILLIFYFTMLAPVKQKMTLLLQISDKDLDEL